MSDSFFNTSKKIANDFLQNIVLIDDKAYSDEEGKNHDFNAFHVSQAFAKSKKVCAIYRPETLEDIENLTEIAKKADITIIDWQINLKKEPVPVGKEEEDSEVDDPRGPHTLKIIREILSNPLTGKGSVKLILIYTGETDLPGITDTIFKTLSEDKIPNLKKEDCSILTENIKILVIAKSGQDAGEENVTENRFKYNSGLNDKIVRYENLPEFILNEFTKMTAGLLSNFVLASLTILRNNTFRLIKLYDKQLDSPFVSHRLLLPNQEDSKEQLIELLSHSLQALLNYNNVGDTVSLENIEEWIDIDTTNFSHTLQISNKDILLNDTFIKNWAQNDFIIACTNYWTSSQFGEVTDKVTENIQKKRDKLHELGSSFLLKGSDSSKYDSEFSILTHHKSNLKQPSTIPKLSLGSILKQESSNEYFLCIQAKCDSVRLNNIRKFLFLPLIVVSGNSKFQIVIEENSTYTRLKISKDTFELKTVKFLPTTGHSAIVAEQDENGLYYFKSSYEERYFWLSDLKDNHAQRIANNFAAQLSRVGLDESEWLRRWAGN